MSTTPLLQRLRLMARILDKDALTAVGIENDPDWPGDCTAFEVPDEAARAIEALQRELEEAKAQIRLPGAAIDAVVDSLLSLDEDAADALATDNDNMLLRAKAKGFVDFVLRHTWPERAKAHGCDAVYSVIKHHPFAVEYDLSRARSEEDETQETKRAD